MIRLATKTQRHRKSPSSLATWALREELATWPKPGLVSPYDRGSHGDMDADLFEAAIAVLDGYFAKIYSAGRKRAALAELRKLGLAAEAKMLQATQGINTHRGAIFSLGLLVAAAGRRARDATRAARSLGDIVHCAWGPDLARVEPGCSDSHGLVVARHHGVGGARGEAAGGFRCIYEIGLPALRRAREAGWNFAKVQCLFALIAELDDTNLLYRGGADGLAFARSQARAYLDAGGVLQPDRLSRAVEVHRQFVARRLSPGGAGDLLAATIFVDALESAILPEP